MTSQAKRPVKRPYQTPVLKVYGDILTVTGSNPAGTSKNDAAPPFKTS